MYLLKLSFILVLIMNLFFISGCALCPDKGARETSHKSPDSGNETMPSSPEASVSLQSEAGGESVAMKHNDNETGATRMKIPQVEDFELTGDGAAGEWQAVAWQPLTKVGEGPMEYATRMKAAVSKTGLYFLVDCEDRLLSCTMTADYESLFREDVIEIFLQPDTTQRIYIEYEISPLGYELVLRVANDGEHFSSWRPWTEKPANKIRRATSVRGGDKKPHAKVSGWTVEVYLPFAIFRGLGNAPPAFGSEWRGNVYRIDYDEEKKTHWAWCPATGKEFHDFRNFGVLEF